MSLTQPSSSPAAPAVGGAVIEALSADGLPAVWDLYRRAMPFPPPPVMAPYWQWRFERHPVAGGARPTFWVVKLGDRVVGGMAQFPAVLEVEGRALTAQWAGDFMIDPALRGHGLGTRLFDHYRAGSEVALSMGYAPDSATSRVARAVGFRALPPIPYLFKFYTLRPLLARLPKILGRTASRPPLLRRLLRRVGAGGVGEAPPDVTLREIGRFDDEFATLWGRVAEEANREGQIVVRRTPETMNWRYVDNPLDRYRAVGAWRGGRLDGCLVVKAVDGKRFRYGTVPELIALSRDVPVQRGLLGWGLAALETAGVDVVKALFSAPHLSRLLREAGFLPLGKGCDVVFAVRPDVAATLRTAGWTPTAWYLTKGDADCDIVPDFLTVT